MMRSATVGACVALLFSAFARGQGCGLEATPIPGLGLGPGVTGQVYDMTMFDDGSGEALIVGGSFTVLDASGRSIQGVARWDGSEWSSIGETGNVQSIVAFDDGSGPALIAAGFFGAPLPHEERTIRRWKDGAWGPIGDGLRTGGYGIVRAVDVVEYEGGQALVAVGEGLRASGETVSAAVWNGAEWEPLGNDLGVSLFAVESFQGALYAGANASEPLYRLEGAQWIAVPEIPSGTRYMQTYHDGGVEYLYLGGAGDDRVSRFDGAEVEPVDAGLDRDARGFAVAMEGGVETLYVTSGFILRRYDGADWSTVGAVDGRFRDGDAVLAADLFGEETVIIGGNFESVDSLPALSIAARSDRQWRPLGRAAPPVIRAIVEAPGPGDDAVYVGGTGLFDLSGRRSDIRRSSVAAGRRRSGPNSTTHR